MANTTLTKGFLNSQTRFSSSAQGDEPRGFLIFLSISLLVAYTDLACLMLNRICLWFQAILISGPESEGTGMCVLSQDSGKLMPVLARVALSKWLTRCQKFVRRCWVKILCQGKPENKLLAPVRFSNVYGITRGQGISFWHHLGFRISVAKHTVRKSISGTFYDQMFHTVTECGKISFQQRFGSRLSKSSHLVIKAAFSINFHACAHLDFFKYVDVFSTQHLGIEY